MRSSVVAYLVSASCVLGACSAGEPFDAAAWAQAGESERFVFVEDLMERRVLEGRDFVEVKALLGPPSYESPDGTYITYIVGPGKWFSFDAITLLDVRFDKGRKVQTVITRGD